MRPGTGPERGGEKRDVSRRAGNPFLVHQGKYPDRGGIGRVYALVTSVYTRSESLQSTISDLVSSKGENARMQERKNARMQERKNARTRDACEREDGCHRAARHPRTTDRGDRVAWIGCERNGREIERHGR